MGTPGLKPSIRAQFTERRTYLRPLDEDGKLFETPDQAMDRVIGHQRWLWEQQLNRKLKVTEEGELSELRRLIAERKVSVSGRVKWMGGTQIIKERSSAAFNCSFTNVQTPADLVDVFWLLLQGCFVRGTQVKMADGSYKNIEDIEEGDMVLSYDQESKDFTPSRVEKLNENPSKPMVRVTLEDGTKITCTEDHRFLTEDGEWIEAKDLAGRKVVRHAKG
jgi:hypothetical protein